MPVWLVVLIGASLGSIANTLAGEAYVRRHFKDVNLTWKERLRLQQFWFLHCVAVNHFDPPPM